MVLSILFREQFLRVCSHPWTKVVMCNVLLSPAVAEDIVWSSNFFAPANENSSGSPLDANYIFHLGAFDPPPPGSGEPAWVPTPSNTAEWAQHWVTADAVAYNPITSNFSSSYDVVPAVEGVSLTGKQGYIWGLNRAHPEGEWILLTNPGWIWPAPGAGGIGGFGANWEVAGSTAILGAIDQGGVHMKTVEVSSSAPPLLLAAMWQQAHFSEEEIDVFEATVSGWAADPNQNGRPNLLEYAYGTDPLVPHHEGEPSGGMITQVGEEYQTLTVTRDPSTEVTFAAEVTSDLVQWFSDPGNVVLESEALTTLVFRDLTPRSAGDLFRGMRVRASLP